MLVINITSHPMVSHFFQVYPIIMLLFPRKVLVDACRSPAMADFPILSLGAKKPVGPLGDESVEAVKRAAQRSPLVVAAASNTLVDQEINGLLKARDIVYLSAAMSMCRCIYIYTYIKQ